MVERPDAGFIVADVEKAFQHTSHIMSKLGGGPPCFKTLVLSFLNYDECFANSNERSQRMPGGRLLRSCEGAKL